MHIQVQHLVGGLEHFLFSIIYGIIIPTDFHIFQRGGSTTNQTSSQYLSDFWAIFPGHDREAVGDAIYGLKITALVALKAGCRVRGCAARPGVCSNVGVKSPGISP
jgi:hypothetical protein